jgi:hypothetical protein
VTAIGASWITHEIQTLLPDVVVVVATGQNGAPDVSWGDTFFFYDPHGRGGDAQKFPFATIVSKDYGEFDNASNLDREGVYRLNVGLSSGTYDLMFPPDSGPYDFTRLDVVMPYPIYGRNHWVCVLNPSAATVDSLRPLLAEAHGRSVRRYEKLTQ